MFASSNLGGKSEQNSLPVAPLEAALAVLGLRQYRLFVESPFGKLILAAGSGEVGSSVEGLGSLSLPGGKEVTRGIAERVYREGGELVLDQAHKSPDYDPEFDITINEKKGSKRVFTAPLLTCVPSEVLLTSPSSREAELEEDIGEPEVIGALQILGRDDMPFSPMDVTLLTGLAIDIGVHITHHRGLSHSQRLASLYKGCVEILHRPDGIAQLPPLEVLAVAGRKACHAVNGEAVALFIGEDGPYADANTVLRRCVLGEDGWKYPGKLLEPMDVKSTSSPPKPEQVGGARKAIGEQICLRLTPGNECIIPTEDFLSTPAVSCVLLLPLATTEGTPFGCIAVYGARLAKHHMIDGEVELNDYVEDEEALLHQLCQVVSSAVSNVVLEEASRILKGDTE